MSSTKRGAKRSEADFYATPPWCVDRLLDEFKTDSTSDPWRNLPGGRWLEPAAGDGAIIRAVNARRSDVEWSAMEIRPETESDLAPLTQGRVRIGDFLAMQFVGPKFKVAITNPPFRLALPFVMKCIEAAESTILLLRLNFWGSEARASFLRANPADTYVLPNRPMFSLNQKGLPGTDSPEYAWFRWNEFGAPDSWGRIRVLRTTPTDERKLWTTHLKALQAKKLASAVVF